MTTATFGCPQGGIYRTISPHYLSNDVFTPEQYHRITLPHVGIQLEHDVDARRNPERWGDQGPLFYPGNEYPPRKTTVIQSKEAELGFRDYPQKTNLLLSKVRLNDERLPRPLIDWPMLPSKIRPKVDPYFSHKSIFEMFPRHDPERVDASGKKVLEPETEEKLKSYYRHLHGCSTYQCHYKDFSDEDKKLIIEEMKNHIKKLRGKRKGTDKFGHDYPELEKQPESPKPNVFISGSHMMKGIKTPDPEIKWLPQMVIPWEADKSKVIEMISLYSEGLKDWHTSPMKRALLLYVNMESTEALRKLENIIHTMMSFQRSQESTTLNLTFSNYPLWEMQKALEMSVTLKEKCRLLRQILSMPNVADIKLWAEHKSPCWPPGNSTMMFYKDYNLGGSNGRLGRVTDPFDQAKYCHDLKDTLQSHGESNLCLPRSPISQLINPYQSPAAKIRANAPFQTMEPNTGSSVHRQFGNGTQTSAPLRDVLSYRYSCPSLDVNSNNNASNVYMSNENDDLDEVNIEDEDMKCLNPRNGDAEFKNFSCASINDPQRKGNYTYFPWNFCQIKSFIRQDGKAFAAISLTYCPASDYQIFNNIVHLNCNNSNNYLSNTRTNNLQMINHLSQTQINQLQNLNSANEVPVFAKYALGSCSPYLTGKNKPPSAIMENAFKQLNLDETKYKRSSGEKVANYHEVRFRNSKLQNVVDNTRGLPPHWSSTHSLGLLNLQDPSPCHPRNYQTYNYDSMVYPEWRNPHPYKALVHKEHHKRIRSTPRPHIVDQSWYNSKPDYESNPISCPQLHPAVHNSRDSYDMERRMRGPKNTDLMLEQHTLYTDNFQKVYLPPVPLVANLWNNEALQGRIGPGLPIKTPAQQRYHAICKDPIPDLRKNHRTHRRSWFTNGRHAQTVNRQGKLQLNI